MYDFVGVTSISFSFKQYVDNYLNVIVLPVLKLNKNEYCSDSEYYLWKQSNFVHYSLDGNKKSATFLKHRLTRVVGMSTLNSLFLNLSAINEQQFFVD